jgi:hypothetical protein
MDADEIRWPESWFREPVAAPERVLGPQLPDTLEELLRGSRVARMYRTRGNILGLLARDRQLPAPQHPQGPPRPAGPEPLISDEGVVNDYVPGVGYRPRTHFGIEVRDTTVSGIVSRPPSVGPPLPARIPGGPVICGLNSHLYPRAAQRSPFAG